ncbi:hypothetical protein ANCCEY_14046 [Ancylostoma ceylanicum]|uniref:Uncharacterized protein n=1 Tax=Ancylostoma ceylanicum TaxID=53326 RepID=A0A0D6L7G2_9BILA|nr:hypothetical protein ANCCEY_14046 [Ancylostoma ceylanicum]
MSCHYDVDAFRFRTPIAALISSGDAAQCRSREHHDPYAMNEPRSVNRVVASLIRSIEDSRYTAPDRPAHLTVDNNQGQDAATQTSPFSISRSSSFDWINEPTEGGLRDLKTPLSTPRTRLEPSRKTLAVDQ